MTFRSLKPPSSRSRIALLRLTGRLGATARRYHADEFQNVRENYYTQGDEVRGEWHGELAREWELSGAVNEAHFQWLAEGHHLSTDEALVRHQAAHVSTNAQGEHPHGLSDDRFDALFTRDKPVIRVSRLSLADSSSDLPPHESPQYSPAWV